MRIICVVTNDLNYDQRMNRICSSLAEAGYQVTVVGRKRATSTPLREADFRQIRLNCLFDKGPFFYLEFNLRILFWLLFQKFDTVCAIDTDTLAGAFSAALIRGKKRVFDAHEYFTGVPELAGRKTVQRLWGLMERLFIPTAQLCYTVSGSVAAAYEKRTGKTFHLIRNVPVFEPVSNPQKQERLLIYQGALNVGRGLEQLIEAMPQIEARLLLAGDGDITQLLKEQVKKAGLQEKVAFAGMVSPKELKVQTQQATIGFNLLDVRHSESYQFSLANKFFDYLHAGIPQVTMKLPEYESLNREFEVAVIIDNLATQTIAKAVNELLTNKALYQKLAENCRKAASHLSWQNEQKVLLKLYENL